VTENNVKILSPRELSDSICVVVGTRPGIIKMSPIIKELARRKIPHFVLHTGQHYSYRMDRKFFEDLELPEPLHQLPSGRPGSLHGEQTGHMLAGIEAVLLQEKPRLVLVCGDANTNLAGALAARKLQIEVGHVESGLRSNDWRMPEEHNRVIIDHISEYLFAPTARAKQNLIEDNVKGHIFLTGNTVVDALAKHLEIAEAKSNILEKLSQKDHGYILITLHREENVDNVDVLKNIFAGLLQIGEKVNLPMLLPLHPRTRKRLDIFQLTDDIARIAHLKIIDPVGYIDFLMLLSHTRVILTDSGGIQEESCILKVPCVTLRENTERQETVEVGSNTVAGTDPERILTMTAQSLGSARNWPNPFGDGKAAERIVAVSQGENIEEWEF
jgi:UDP-N-acetylglucosamine 2-epimerase (non-hydrolysing)